MAKVAKNSKCPGYKCPGIELSLKIRKRISLTPRIQQSKYFQLFWTPNTKVDSTSKRSSQNVQIFSLYFVLRNTK